MSRLFYVLAVVASVLACNALSHDVLVGDGISILTMSNMSLAYTGDWLLILYAPWCPHCRSLLEKLPELAKEIKSNKGDVTIGVVNADAEPAIQMQFSVHGFPSIFMAHDGEVYEFPTNVGRSVDSLSKFAVQDYAKQPSITGIKSPFGIPMRVFSVYSAFAITSYRFLEVYANKMNIPPLWFFYGVAIFLALFVIVLMIVLARVRGGKKCSAPARKPAAGKQNNDAAIVAPIVEQARAENPIEGAAIAETERVQEKVKKAKEEQKLRRRTAKKDEEGVRDQQKKEQKKLKKSTKGGARQQNMPTQQPSKRA